MSIQELRTKLDALPPGRVDVELCGGLVDLLADCWDSLPGASETSMTQRKISTERVEELTWEPPFLSFIIERHGGLVQGSKSAEVHKWTVDVESGKSVCRAAGFRRLKKFAERMDTQELARELVELIERRVDDPRLTLTGDTCVKVNVSHVIPDDAAKQTTHGRRKRFRSDMEALMHAAGWRKRPHRTLLMFEKN